MASQNWLFLFSLTRLPFFFFLSEGAVLNKYIDRELDTVLVSFNQCSLCDCVASAQELDLYNLCHPDIGTLN